MCSRMDESAPASAAASDDSAMAQITRVRAELQAIDGKLQDEARAVDGLPPRQSSEPSDEGRPGGAVGSPLEGSSTAPPAEVPSEGAPEGGEPWEPPYLPNTTREHATSVDASGQPLSRLST